MLLDHVINKDEKLINGLKVSSYQKKRKNCRSVKINKFITL